MPEGDLKSAVEFQAQELIPIPLDEAILDYQVLDRYVTDDGTDMVRLLIVGAQREMVSRLLASLAEAGLTALAVDLVPFALLRSLADTSGFTDLGGEEIGAEAIVSIGSGVTTVVVHERGVPTFIRTVMAGSNEITQAIAHELSISFDEAEGIKRQVTADVTDGDVVDNARVALKRRTAPFVDEIRSSIEFHTNQNAGVSIKRVVVTGGGRRVSGLVEGLAEALKTPGCRRRSVRELWAWQAQSHRGTDAQRRGPRRGRARSRLGWSPSRERCAATFLDAAGSF